MYDPKYTFVNPKIHTYHTKLGTKLRHVCTFRSIYGSLPTPYVSGHVIYVITSISLSAEFRGYYATSLWARGACVSIANNLIISSISRFGTRTVQNQPLLRRRRETIRPFSINWVYRVRTTNSPGHRASLHWQSGVALFPLQTCKQLMP